MRHVISVSLFISGLIHVLPLVGVIGSSRLNSMYGIQISDPNVVILMRHRAVLFGLLGGYMVIAAFVPAMQATALIAGVISVATFFYFAKAESNYNAHIARVFTMDVIAAACLIAGIAAYAYTAWKA